MQMESEEFSRLIAACHEIAEISPAGHVLIGDLAVYLHTINQPGTAHLAEFTHAADWYTSLADMADLRDIEEVIPNRRLSKHQLIKRGFAFDIYTERQSSLIVPYDAVMAKSVRYESFRVASLEHLFVLKLEAFLDRKGSSKGDKDAKDLLRITSIAARGSLKFDARICAPHIRGSHIDLLSLVETGSHAISMALGDVIQAKKIRQEFAAISQSIRQECENDAPLPIYAVSYVKHPKESS